MTLLIGDNVILIRVLFPVGKMSKFLAVVWDSPPLSKIKLYLGNLDACL